MNPLVIIYCVLHIIELWLEGTTVAQRVVLAQRFIDDTGKVRAQFETFATWFIGLVEKAKAQA